MFANFWRARSRLYRSRCLQVYMILVAFFKLYKIGALFAPLQTRNYKFSGNQEKKNAVEGRVAEEDVAVRRAVRVQDAARVHRRAAAPGAALEEVPRHTSRPCAFR